MLSPDDLRKSAKLHRRGENKKCPEHWRKKLGEQAVLAPKYLDGNISVRNDGS